MTPIDSYHTRLARYEDLSILETIEKKAGAVFVEAGFPTVSEWSTTALDVLHNGIELHRLWVAVDAEDRPVGFALVTILDGNAHLDELDVDPAHGKRGLGGALVETVCTWAQQSGFTAITLTTFRQILWNTPFYQRHGFRILEPAELSVPQQQLMQHDLQWALPGCDRVMMRREL